MNSTLEQFFLNVSQNNFGNKIPFLGLPGILDVRGKIMPQCSFFMPQRKLAISQAFFNPKCIFYFSQYQLHTINVCKMNKDQFF